MPGRGLSLPPHVSIRMVRPPVRMTKVWKEKMSNPFAGSRRRGSSQERWASMADLVACGYIASGGNTGSWNSTTRSMVMSPSVHWLMAVMCDTDQPRRQRENAVRGPLVPGGRVEEPPHRRVVRIGPRMSHSEDLRSRYLCDLRCAIDSIHYAR